MTQTFEVGSSDALTDSLDDPQYANESLVGVVSAVAFNDAMAMRLPGQCCTGFIRGFI